MTTDTNLIAEREQFLFKSFEQLKLNDYLNEKDDSCLMINSLRFSCSTPIKLNLKQSEQEDNNHNILLDQSMINNETEKKTALEIVNTDYLFEKCDLARLNELNETTFKQHQQNSFHQTPVINIQDCGRASTDSESVSNSSDASSSPDSTGSPTYRSPSNSFTGYSSSATTNVTGNQMHQTYNNNNHFSHQQSFNILGLFLLINFKTSRMFFNSFLFSFKTSS